MNRVFSSSASYLALLAAGTVLSVPFTARAGSFTVATGTTQTSQQTNSRTDIGQIEAGSASRGIRLVDRSDPAIEFQSEAHNP
ncbi:MAG: hypothetical protein E5Y58_10600 [Mesorhizobium sp.]|nr:MAG: hypothetical protein E5Y58_10600 [Mesorhizobium sp.]